jgi:hypothetical protein
VLFIQRLDSALRLNVRGHLLSLDGVYVRAADGALCFHELAEPTAEDVAGRTARRLVTVLKKHGREVDPELGEVDVSAGDNTEPSALTACCAAAAAGTDLFGERTGSPALRLVDPSLARPPEPVAIAYGVNVHAAVRVHGFDRAQLERLCRYLGRPPIAEERVVPLPPPAVGNPLLGDDDGQLELQFGGGNDDNGAAASPTRRRTWAWLLRHVWQADVSTCVRCGGLMKWVEVGTEPDAIRRVLAQLEGSAQGHAEPAQRGAWQRCRAPPPEQLGLGFS